LLLNRIDRGEDVEAESYLDVVVTKWLPGRWESANYDRALHALATRFEERHHDRWLLDVLAVKRSEKLVAGLAALAEAVQANLADESDEARKRSAEAADQLRAAGSQSGALRAEFEQTYALHRSLQFAAQCLEKAIVVERQSEAMEYPWMYGQALIEQGICRGQQGNSGAAHRDMARANELARHAGYQDLELRAAGILAGEQTQNGNLLAAWNLGRQGLANYWGGTYPGNRAQQIYYNLARSAEGLDMRQAAYVLERAAATAIADTARRRLTADAWGQAARLAMQAGRPEEAKSAFEQAGSLLDQLQQTGADRQYRILAELYRAEAEAVGAPQAAVKRLEAIRPSTEKIDATLVQIRFQQLFADLLWQTGRRDEAEGAYRRAIDLSEQRLNTFRGFRKRTELMLVAGKAYRGLVELLWERGDRVEALRRWEWFRSGEGPGRGAELDLDQRRKQLRKESFLSYAMLPGGVVAWWFDDRGVEGRGLSVKPEDVEAVASRFLRECADPESDPQALQRDARQLYDWLVAPMADRLDPARTLVIEPDGAAGAIPMQALMDQSGRYLGERFAITVAAGLLDYQQRAAAGPVNADAKALVVASPTLGVEMSKTFPPLAGTMPEGRLVAMRFHRSVLLTGAQATLAAVAQHRPDAGLFHFAGHGFSNAGNGGLLLSPGESGAGGAGVMDGTWMENQDWSRCRLAVLSACSTGTGEARGPVNPESLVRGLLWAGVARVIASRWNVDTETGVPFMDEFYTSLLSGDNTAAALQHAEQRIRERKTTSHPYFWAGFQSFGAR